MTITVLQTILLEDNAKIGFGRPATVEDRRQAQQIGQDRDHVRGIIVISTHTGNIGQEAGRQSGIEEDEAAASPQPSRRCMTAERWDKTVSK